MTVCPFCKALGCKVADYVSSADGVLVRVDYCGKCGKNWPRDLAEKIPADRMPPIPRPPHADPS
jgi:transcriptional regulator NrdR family protein